MNNFIVDNLTFKVDCIKDESINISSHPKDYTLSFESMPELSLDDFLVIDKNPIKTMNQCLTNSHIVIQYLFYRLSIM